MKDRRKPASEVTPDYEDSGIFKTPTTQLVVGLVPRLGRNTRLDLMIKGFVQGEAAIDVVFAGRRRAQAEPLVQMLNALWTRANRQADKTGSPPEVDDVRLPVRIEGCWRPRFARDDQGWQTRTFQLYASRWLVTDSAGTAHAFGEPPVRAASPAEADARPKD